LDPFQFVIALVAILTIGTIAGKIVGIIGRAFDKPKPPPPLKAESTRDPDEAEAILGAIGEVMSRVEQLEEERDFYRELLESSGARKEIQPPGAAEEK
jgi:hypothetical protein